MAMTLRLDEDELEALRVQADAEGRSMHEVVKTALREYTGRHSQLTRVSAILDETLPRYKEALERLGNS